MVRRQVLQDGDRRVRIAHGGLQKEGFAEVEFGEGGRAVRGGGQEVKPATVGIIPQNIVNQIFIKLLIHLLIVPPCYKKKELIGCKLFL